MKTRLITAAATLAALATPSIAQVELGGPVGAASVQVVSYRDLPFRSVVRQQYDFSCGSAALATLLRHHYGRDVDERVVFEAMYAIGDQEQIRKVGFSLLDMKRYLEGHGYESDGFRLTLDELAESGSPAIVMVDNAGYRHFAVLKGVDAARVLVGDPALGLKVYTREEFTRIWNGVVFMIRDPAEQLNKASDWVPWARVSLDQAPETGSLASLTQQLPPLYQITASFSLDPYLR
jgi:hypothetical protein